MYPFKCKKCATESLAGVASRSAESPLASSSVRRRTVFPPKLWPTRLTFFKMPFLSFVPQPKEVARFPPKFINFQIGHDVIQLLIIVDIAYPVAKNAVGPAQIGLHIDDGNADGKVLHGIGRRLIDAARNGIEKLAYFSAAFIMILAGQDVGTAGQDDCQQGNDPIVDGNDKNQQDSNQEKRAVRPS